MQGQIRREERPSVNCVKCGHIWKPYTNNPAKCPVCHSNYWNANRKIINKIKQTITYSPINIGQENNSASSLNRPEEL